MAPRNPLSNSHPLMFSEKKMNNAFYCYWLLVIRNVCTSCVLRYLVMAPVNLLSNSLSPMFSEKEVNDCYLLRIIRNVCTSCFSR